MGIRDGLGVRLHNILCQRLSMCHLPKFGRFFESERLRGSRFQKFKISATSRKNSRTSFRRPDERLEFYCPAKHAHINIRISARYIEYHARCTPRSHHGVK